MTLRVLLRLISAAVAVGLFAAPGKAPAQVYNWTGAYIGGSVGIGAGDVGWNNPDLGGLGVASKSGLLFWGNAGYNVQNGPFVWGIEAYAGFSTVEGEFRAFNWDFRSRIQSYEAVTGRVGFTSGERGEALYYARGGVAGAQYRYTSFWPEINTFFDANKTVTGWAAGVGYERVIAPNFTIKLDYVAYTFPSTSLNLTPNQSGVAPFPIQVGGATIHTFNFGVNYKLSGAVERTQRNFYP